MNNFTLKYDKMLDVFEVKKNGNYNVVEKIEGNYGIEFYLDIDTNIVAISFPEPSTLFGINKKFFNNFANNIFT